MNDEQDTASDPLWDRNDHPWRRYGARTIDTYLFGEIALVIIVLLIAMLGPDALLDWIAQASMWKSIFVTTPLMWLLSIPATAGLLAWKGTTPGKWMLGLRVVTAHESQLRFSRALRREATMLVWGVGFAIPLFSLVAILNSYNDLTTEHQTRWDRDCGLITEARSAKGWQLLGILVGALIVLAMLGWGLFERLMGAFV